MTPRDALRAPHAAGPLLRRAAARGRARATAGRSATPAPPDPPRRRAPAPVLRGWGDALRRDRNRRAARYFALPAIVAQASVLMLETAAQVRAFNDRLPCGVRLLRVQQDGRFLVGTFKLTRRPAHSCNTPGRRDPRRVRRCATGKIAEWRQVRRRRSKSAAARSVPRTRPSRRCRTSPSTGRGRASTLRSTRGAASRRAEEEQRDHQPEDAAEHQDQPDRGDVEPGDVCVTAK